MQSLTSCIINCISDMDGKASIEDIHIQCDFIVRPEAAARLFSKRMANPKAYAIGHRVSHGQWLVIGHMISHLKCIKRIHIGKDGWMISPDGGIVS